MKKNIQTQILFVCFGNICRSPTAEGIFKSLIEEDSWLSCDSAATHRHNEGLPADGQMRRHAKTRGYLLTSIARKIREEDFKKFDLILAMDRSNLEDLYEQLPDEVYRSKIFKITHFSQQYKNQDVPDPYGGGPEGFEQVLDMLEETCQALRTYLLTSKKP